ncbi:MAG: hypothetical protein AAFX99_03795 [Myxococcota bacterium]
MTSTTFKRCARRRIAPLTTLILMAALTSLAAVACSDSDYSGTDQCGSGDSFAYDQQDYCLYQQEIIEEGFRCPAGVPFRHDFDTFTACAPNEDLPEGFQESAESLDGYGPSGPNNNTGMCPENRGDGSHPCYSVPGPDHIYLPNCDIEHELWRVFQTADGTAYMIPRPDQLGLEFGICGGDDAELSDLFERNNVCGGAIDLDIINAMTPADAQAIAAELHRRVRFEARGQGDSWDAFPFAPTGIRVAACNNATNPSDDLTAYCNTIAPNYPDYCFENRTAIGIVYTEAQARAMAAALNDLYNDPSTPNTSDTCQVLLGVEVLEEGEQVNAVMTNITDTTVTVTLDDRCPDSYAIWSGAGDDYDYYDSCASGACDPDRPPTTSFELAPGASENVGSVPLGQFTTGGSCNEPIASGTSITLGFSVSLSGTNPEICGPETLTLTLP